MVNFVLSRIMSACVVIFGVIILVFFLIHLIPGDPVEVMLGESAQPADRELLRQQLGLDKTIPEQFWLYLSGLGELNLGNSLHARKPVFDLLLERMPATIQLTFSALAVAVFIALPLGTIAAIKRGSIWDQFAIGFATLGVSIPNFVMGPILILVFSFALGWLPVSGSDAPGSIILPALTLGTALAAVLARMLRSTLLEVLGEDFIRTARAKGLNEFHVVVRHALGNAMLPIITLLGLQLGVLLAGAVITEIVFSWPGLGSLTIESIERRDYPVVQGCVLVISLIYVLVNSLTDLAYAWLDPRIHYGVDD
jgi:peptide/nickel transport system permease protein